MAFAYASVQTSNSGTTTVTVTKPTSLAEGDLMVAHCAGSNASATGLNTAYSLSGWTLIAGDQSDSGTATHRADALFKVATAGDVAASDFTFTGDADLESTCGAIYRFTDAAGTGGGIPDGAADDDPSTTTTHTFTNTLTPAFINCIMLHLTSCVDNGGTAWSAQAITTNNPSWTERYDVANTGAAGDGDTTMAGATATRPEVTASGNSTATSGTSTDAVGIVVAVYPLLNVTASPAVISVLITYPTVGVGNTQFPSTVGVTVTLPAPTITVADPVWSNQTKNSNTWTNQSKS